MKDTAGIRHPAFKTAEKHLDALTRLLPYLPLGDCQEPNCGTVRPYKPLCDEAKARVALDTLSEIIQNA